MPEPAGKTTKLVFMFSILPNKTWKIPSRTASVLMQSESLIYAFIAMCTNLPWLVLGLFITCLYLRRAGSGATFSWDKSWGRWVFEGQGFRRGKRGATELRARVRQFTGHKAGLKDASSSGFPAVLCCGDNPTNPSSLSPRGPVHHVWCNSFTRLSITGGFHFLLVTGFYL